MRPAKGDIPWTCSFLGRALSLDVLFRDKELRECTHDPRKATRKFGKAVSCKYIERTLFLIAAESIEQIPRSWWYHQLSGNREGQHTLDINKDKDVRLILTELEPVVVRIEEVSTTHYGH